MFIFWSEILNLCLIYMHKSNFQKSRGGGGNCPPMPKHTFVPRCGCGCGGSSASWSYYGYGESSVSGHAMGAGLCRGVCGSCRGICVVGHRFWVMPWVWVVVGFIFVVVG